MSIHDTRPHKMTMKLTPVKMSPINFLILLSFLFLFSYFFIHHHVPFGFILFAPLNQNLGDPQIEFAFHFLFPFRLSALLFSSYKYNIHHYAIFVNPFLEKVFLIFLLTHFSFYDIMKRDAILSVELSDNLS